MRDAYLNWDAETLRKAANDASRRRQESEDRSDTDGFLSQYCNSLSSQLYTRQAEIVEAGGVANFPGLFNAAGERVRAKLCVRERAFDPVNPWKSGTSVYWMILDANGKNTRQYFPHGKNSRKQKAAGLHEAMEQAPAMAVIESSGRGLSGTAWVAVKRKDKGYPDNAVDFGG